MTLSINLRKMLHRKSPEYCTPLPGFNTIAGGLILGDKSDFIPGHDTQYYIGGTSAIWNYVADQDGWQQIPNSGVAGTFGAGSCGEFRALSAPGGAITNTATGGTTTKINTNLNTARNCAGYRIVVVAGTGIGYSGTIKSNTLGANAVFTVNIANGVAFDATTQYRIFAGSLWFLNAGTPGFAVYDRLTNTWTQRSVVGLPAWGTEGQLVSTPGQMSNGGNGFVSANATSATSTTIVDSTKTFPVSGWVNSQVRIVSGTGAGQIRAITANTATTLTVAAWTVIPDATSVYRIEGNDDFIYLLGNNAVTIFRYSISANTWATVAPIAARAGVYAAGGTADWVDACANTEWTDGLYAAHNQAGTILRQNGRYLFSFRGGASNLLDVYDIAANTWISGVAYGGQFETFTTGSCSFDFDGVIYIQKDSTGRIFLFDVARNVLEPFALNPVPQGAAVAGDKMFGTTLVDGGKVQYLYTLGHTRPELTRWVVI